MKKKEIIKELAEVKLKLEMLENKLKAIESIKQVVFTPTFNPVPCKYCCEIDCRTMHISW